jgi:hypothetical protein
MLVFQGDSFLLGLLPRETVEDGPRLLSQCGFAVIVFATSGVFACSGGELGRINSIPPQDGRRRKSDNLGDAERLGGDNERWGLKTLEFRGLQPYHKVS